MQHLPSLVARSEGLRWLAPLVIAITLAGASPAHGFTLRLVDVVAFAQTAGTPLPPMQLSALDFTNVVGSQESVSTVAWDFGTGVVGSAELNGELYDLMTAGDAFRLVFMDGGDPKTQLLAEGELFMIRPELSFRMSYANARFFGEVEHPVIFETDAISTLTLIAGIGTPFDFAPTGDEWENSVMVSQNAEEAVVPEPGSAALLAAGLAAVGLMKARRSKQRPTH